MSRTITIDARWDGDAAVWLATSHDVHGLVVETDDWPTIIREVQVVLPDLLALEGEREIEFSLTFRRRFDDLE